MRNNGRLYHDFVIPNPDKPEKELAARRGEVRSVNCRKWKKIAETLPHWLIFVEWCDKMGRKKIAREMWKDEVRKKIPSVH